MGINIPISQDGSFPEGGRSGTGLKKEGGEELKGQSQDSLSPPNKGRLKRAPELRRILGVGLGKKL